MKRPIAHGRSLTRALAAIGCVATLTACPAPGPEPGTCTAPYAGDAAAPIALEAFFIGTDHQNHPLADCGAIDIVQPPQGGKVLFVGLRATNLDPCSPSITVGLRDPQGGGLLGAEMRTVNLAPIAGRAGWVETEADGDAVFGYRNLANVPVCPNVNARDIQEQVQALELQVTDRAGKQGSAELRVVPRCDQADAQSRAECNCTCEAGYRVDKCANVSEWPEPPAIACP